MNMLRDSFAGLLFAIVIILVAGQSVAGSLPLWVQIQALTTPEPQAQRVAGDVFLYLHDREGIVLPQIEGFSEKEDSHMSDVKWVLRLLEGVLYVSLWVFLGLLLVSQRKSSICLWGSCLALAFLLIMLVIPFDSLFVWFHHVFFSAGSWVFEGGLMIASFPGAFFAWLAQIWWMRAFSAGSAIALVSFIASKKAKTTTLI